MTEVVHCLFIDREGKQPLVINLTNAYVVKFPAPMTLSITVNPARYVTDGVHAAGVAGMTVLYGENGAGKTKAMIDAANVFGDNQKERTAGGLYERDGELLLRRGKALKGYGPVRGMSLPRHSDDSLRCLAVYYTTSPFDAQRRGRLRPNPLARDVSPVYGERNRFDGLSLLKIRERLRMPFLDRTDVRVKLQMRSVSDTLTAIYDLMGRKLDPHLTVVRRAVIAAAGELPELEQMQLRCWLALFVAAHERKARPFSTKFARLLDQFPASEDRHSDLYELWKTVIRDTDSCMPEDQMRPVMELLQLLSKPEFSRMFAKSYKLETLQALIDSELAGRNEGLRQCTDLGLLEFSFSGLSSGETAYAMIFSSIYGALERVSRIGGRHPVLLLLDEGEMFLHPTWQREYIAKLLEFVQHVPRLKGRLYLVLATHSLIVAADAPPNSLLNVASGEQANGFGLGPRSTLADIYNVDVFHGRSSEAEFARIEAFIKEPRRADHEGIKALTATLADLNVKAFIEEQVDEAMQRSRA